MRDVIELNAVTFKGVVEVDNGYGILCNGVYPTDSGTLIPLTYAKFSFEGEFIDKNMYFRSIGYNLVSSRPGFKYINDEFKFCGIGYKTNTGDFNEGFVAGFNELGDTMEIKYFFSPYYEEMGSSTNTPVEFCNSTNNDNSIFISGNILNTESGTGGDFYIQRMKPDGEVLWEFIYATDAQPEYCFAILPTQNGGGREFFMSLVKVPDL